jgi:hypothetical protein
VLISVLGVSQGRVTALRILRRIVMRLKRYPDVVSVGLQRLLSLLVEIVRGVASKKAGEATVTTLGEAVEEILLRRY